MLRREHLLLGHQMDTLSPAGWLMDKSKQNKLPKQYLPSLWVNWSFLLLLSYQSIIFNSGSRQQQAKAEEEIKRQTSNLCCYMPLHIDFDTYFPFFSYKVSWDMNTILNVSPVNICRTILPSPSYIPTLFLSLYLFFFVLNMNFIRQGIDNWLGESF